MHGIFAACHPGPKGTAIIERIDALLAQPEARAAAQGYYNELLRPAERELLRRRLPVR